MNILDGSRDYIISRSLYLIKAFEGFRSTIYDDGAGVLTIGFGTTDRTIINQYIDKAINKKVAEQIAIQEIESILTKLETVVTRDLGNNQIAALVGFIYNLGFNTFKHSSLLCAVNERQSAEEVAKCFVKYVYAHVKGQPKMLLGLARRRLCEAKLYTNGSLDLKLKGKSESVVNNYVASIQANKLPW